MDKNFKVQEQLGLFSKTVYEPKKKEPLKDTFVQLPLDLSYRKSLDRADFLVASCNQEAVSWIDRFPDWPMPALLIYGESGCGKTHLASIFSDFKLDGATLAEDYLLPKGVKKVVVEQVDMLTSEQALFHIYNQVVANNGALLMTAREIPYFHLKDLQSRLNGMPKIVIENPDDEVIFTMLAKAFQERNIQVQFNVLDYAVTRMPRSFSSVEKLMKSVDFLLIGTNRNVTVPMIKEALKVFE